MISWQDTHVSVQINFQLATSYFKNFYIIYCTFLEMHIKFLALKSMLLRIFAQWKNMIIRFTANVLFKRLH